MKKARYESLNGLRTIACIGIVLMHIRSNIYYKLGNDIVNNIIQGFTDFVYLFMILSAFGMCCGYYNKVKNNEMDLEVFYQRRFQKVLPFFALLLIINVIYEHTSSSLIEAFSEFTLMFGFIQKDIKVLGVAWFLGIIFIFYFIFPYFVYLFSNKKRAWSTTLIAIAMNLVGAFYFHIDRTNFFYSFLYFCVGGLIYLYKDDLIKLVSKHRIITILLVFLSIFMYYGLGNLKTILFIRVIPLCVLLIAYAITFNSKMLNNNFTQIIGGGGVSMDIYLSHMLVFRVAQKLNLEHIFKNDYLSYFTISIIVLVGAFIFSKSFQVIFNKIKRSIYHENTISK